VRGQCAPEERLGWAAPLGRRQGELAERVGEGAAGGAAGGTIGEDDLDAAGGR